MIQFQNNHKRQKPGHQVLFKEILPLRGCTHDSSLLQQEKNWYKSEGKSQGEERLKG